MDSKIVNQLLSEQYELVKSSRKELLNYCAQLPPTDFIKENSAFGRDSIRNLLVHIANVYEYWIKFHVRKEHQVVTQFEEVENIIDCKKYFDKIDELVANFIFNDAIDFENPILTKLGDVEIKVTPLKVFTHIITHEFHHKGQILSLSRHLGYTPIDTDIIR